MKQSRYDTISALANSFYGHPANTANPFYDIYRKAPLGYEQLRLVAHNYYAHVDPTVDLISLALLRMSDVTARSVTVLNMSDELGQGNSHRAHCAILRNFFSTLLSKVKGEEESFDPKALDLLPSTMRVRREIRELFGSDHEEISCGALLAQEWNAYPQLIRLYEGTRNYMPWFSLEDFHRNSEYFYIHIGNVEKEHQDQSIASAARICVSDEQMALLKYGFDRHLDLIHDFWSCLADAVLAVEAAPAGRALAS